MLHYHPPQGAARKPPGRLLLAVLAGLWMGIAPLWAPPSLSAPAAEKASPGSAVPGERSRQEIAELIRRLEDPGERAKLIAQLRLLLEERKKVAPAPKAPSTSINHLYVQFIRRTNEYLAKVLSGFRALPETFRALAEDVRARLSGLNVLWALARFVVAVAIALVLLVLVRRMLSRFLPPLEETAPAGGWPSRLRGALRQWLERALPPAALLVGGSLLVLLFDLGATEAGLLLILLWALFLQPVILGAVTALLAPERPPWRLLPASDEMAAYFSVWSRRLVVVWVWGNALVQASETLDLGPGAAAALASLYRLVLLLQALVLIFQMRERIRDLLSAREPEEAGRTVQVMVAAWNIAVARWHFLAVPYFLALFAFWSTGSHVGIRYMLEATLLSIVILIGAFVLNHLLQAFLTRLFAVKEKLKDLVPGIEDRVNLYTPLITRTVGVVIWATAFLLVLDAWGVPALDEMFSAAGLSLLRNLAGILVTIAVAVGVIEGIRAVIDYFLSGRKDDEGNPIAPTPQQQTLLPLGYSVIKWATITIAAITVLGNLGVNIAPVLAGAGILGLAVGFGAQSLVKDVITGVFMLIEDNIAVGNVVKVKEIGGLVEGFNLRSVRLRDYDGNVHVIPNGAIDVVTNFTKEYSRAVFDIGVAYREDVDEVIEVIRKVDEEMRADPEWRDVILEPVEIAGLEKFADSALIIRGRFKTQPIKQWSVRREFHRRIKKAFDERGIEIPFPYRTLTYAEPKGAAPAQERAGEAPAFPLEESARAGGGGAGGAAPPLPST